MKILSPQFDSKGAVACVLMLLSSSLGFSVGTVTISARPSYADISSATAEGAVKVTLSGYPAGSAPKYRVYNTTTQYNC